MDTLPLHDNQGRLNYWLYYAQRCVAYAQAEVMRLHCEERGKSYVVTPPQWGALTLLYVEDGLTIGSMSQKRGVDAPTATGIVKRLEQSGLVERRHDYEDRRQVKVFLTDEGRDILETMTVLMQQFDQTLKSGFSESEFEHLLAQLQKIIVNISEVRSGLGDRFGLLPKESDTESTQL